ncbi:MAG: hypothetical protein B6244_08030 [Candidatus Cloacimonetes bacterium 4572_55]|nr:MAG: hypothetical protein B6244_08030 [Candidatus Cloacimonetes bacterium 4572_55]
MPIKSRDFDFFTKTFGVSLSWIIRHHGNRSADYADYRRLRIDLYLFCQIFFRKTELLRVFHYIRNRVTESAESAQIRVLKSS